MDKLVLMSSFVAVVEEGNFTKAAKKLGKTKAIISKQVNQLEEHLNVRLINRTTRTLSITDDGKTIYKKCLKILDEVAHLEVEANQTAEKSLSGRLRLTAPQKFGEVELMDVLTDFMMLHPHIHVELFISDRYINLVEDGYDMAIRIGALEDSTLIARPLARMKTLLVASPEWIKEWGPIQHPKDLEKLPCIHDTNRKDGARWLFESPTEAITLRIQSRLNVNSAVATCTAAINGLGAALSPEFAVRTALETGQLVHLLPEFTVPSYSGIYAIYPNKKHLSPKVQELVKFLQKKWQTLEAVS